MSRRSRGKRGVFFDWLKKWYRKEEIKECHHISQKTSLISLTSGAAELEQHCARVWELGLLHGRKEGELTQGCRSRDGLLFEIFSRTRYCQILIISKCMKTSRRKVDNYGARAEIKGRMQIKNASSELWTVMQALSQTMWSLALFLKSCIALVFIKKSDFEEKCFCILLEPLLCNIRLQRLMKRS